MIYTLTYYEIHYSSGHFYIGSTTTDNVQKYIRSKSQYLIKKYHLTCSDFTTKTKKDFNSEKELRDFEYEKIKENIKNPFCLNHNLQANQQTEIANNHICPECGGKGNKHKVGCSLAKKCKECGGINGNHKKECTLANICSECGASSNNHLKTCSKYKQPVPCPECGGIYRHFKICSKYKEIICDECGSKDGKHKKTCSKFKPRKGCKECGTKSKHKPWCSKSRKNKERNLQG